MTKLIYNDKDISISAQEVEIFNYYFPFRSSKKINLKEIKSVKQVPLTLLNGHYKAWGMGIRPYWLNLSYRLDKDFGLVIDTGKVVKPLVTPKDVSQVMHVLALMDVPVQHA